MIHIMKIDEMNAPIRDLVDFENNHQHAWEVCRTIFDDDITYATGDEMEDAINKLYEDGELTDDEYNFIRANWEEVVGD